MKTEDTKVIEEYEMVGVTTMADHPDIVTGCILRDTSTGGQFRASMLECQKLISNGSLKLPDL